MTEKFMFYRNFFEAVPEDKRKEVCYAIANYVFNGIEPEDDNIRMIINLIKPSLDKKVGGAPLGNNNAQKQPKKQPLKQGLKQPKKQPQKQQLNSIEKQQTKTETETKTKTETNISEKNYAFEGVIIKLSKKDFDEWKERYKGIDLEFELGMLDLWLQRQDSDKKESWFFVVQSLLLKKQKEKSTSEADMRNIRNGIDFRKNFDGYMRS